MQTKYKLNDILFLVHGDKIIKCVVNEIVTTESLEKVTVKYHVRPYGLPKLVVIPEENLYVTLNEAVGNVRTILAQKYYETMEGLDNLKEDYFDMLENNMLQQKENENVG
jgi:hypothetical protein